MLSFLQYIQLNEVRKREQTGTVAVIGPEGASIDDRNANIKQERPIKVRSSKIKSVLEPDEQHAQKEGSAERVKSMTDVLKRGGKLPPLHVRELGSGFQVLDGHHRWKAHRAAGSKQVPIVVIKPQNITQENN